MCFLSIQDNLEQRMQPSGTAAKVPDPAEHHPLSLLTAATGAAATLTALFSGVYLLTVLSLYALSSLSHVCTARSTSFVPAVNSPIHKSEEHTEQCVVV